jgi:CspA family cold shock protein
MSVKGKLRWFNTKKGFGFIIPEDGSKDVFVHAQELYKSQINPQTLTPSMVMHYTLAQGSKGLFATELRLEK